MNLLDRRLEIPLVVWNNGELSLQEKILLAALYNNRDTRGSLAVTYHDIARSIRVSSQKAATMMQALGDKSLLHVTKTEGRRHWIRIDNRLSKEIEREGKQPRLRLTMYFIQCLCEHDLRMDYADQIRVCPHCLRVVYLTPEEKRYVRRLYKHK